ncbi:MAG: asparagine synthase (glutamine-hydrolyzing) [Pelagibacteraceae bacterium TMED237]|nr:MAG: asparagine synthase (glutamine-hydrolyzing) [Pelagibacteraceae bacterium TMED237]|tara:strand:+ start:3064 stop:4674 length:1611 start_codon:yes stop_codon:yes gene_type:complete
MCGIFAIILNNSETSIKQIYDSFDMIKNRGPDSYQIKYNKNFIFFFTRLSINDLSNYASQPFVLNDNYLMCNGEIFNYKKLVKQYNLQLNSNSDCECIIHLEKYCGFEETVNMLDGDFAIVLYTPNKVYFARDRIGVRPLYYGYTKNGNIVFASYARALSLSCTDIQEVLPGWGEYDNKTKLLTHYTYDFLKKERYIDTHEHVIKELLVTSVKKRLLSDRPIGCLLSGGLDSSLITSILCKQIDASNVKTYSIGMIGSEDLKHARIVSDYLGTKHTEINFTAEEGFGAIKNVIRDLESYDITTIRASVGMWLAAKWIKENTEDVVLYSGEGADEIFCGYLYFHYAPNEDELGKESRRLIKDIHQYDVLRADRCISSHGLELRVPFLDRDLVEYIQNSKSEYLKPKNNIEKWILRNSFKNKYLPDEVLWRRKDGMSDGISGNNGKKWYEQIAEFVDPLITDEECKNFPSKEACYYKKIFDEIFPTYQPNFYYWLPKWIECNGDPSGRILKVFNQNNNINLHSNHSNHFSLDDDNEDI